MFQFQIVVLQELGTFVSYRHEVKIGKFLDPSVTYIINDKLTTYYTNIEMSLDFKS